MPKPINNQELLDQAREKVVGYVENNDYEGLYDYIFSNMKKANETGEDFFGTEEGVQLQSIIMYCASGDEQKYFQFINDFYAYAVKKNFVSYVEAGEKYEKVKKQYENDEIEGAELVSDDTKIVDQLAMATMATKTEEGKNLHLSRSLMRIVSGFLMDGNYYAITDNGKTAGEEAFKAENKLPEDKTAFFINTFSKDIGLYIFDKASTAKPAYTLSANSPDNKLFDEVPDNISKISDMNTDELEEYKNKLKEDIATVEIFENAGIKWAEDAKKLSQDMDKLPPEVKTSKEFTDLKSALDNAGNIGKSVDFFVEKHEIDPVTNKDEIVMHPATELGFSKASMDYTFKDVMEKAEAFKAVNPDFSEKVKSIAENKKSEVDNAFVTGADRIHEQLGIDKAQSKVLKTSLGRVEKQLESLAIKNKYPYNNKQIDKRKKEITKLEKGDDDITEFRRRFKNAIDQSKSLYRYFDKDKQGRGDLVYNKHKDYLNLVDLTKRLNESDPDKMKPREIIDLLINVKNAAKQYVDTHAGAKNITKGWLGDGRIRIENARKLEKVVDTQLSEVFEKYRDTERFCKKNETIGDALDRLGEKKEKIRSEIRDKKQELSGMLKENVAEVVPRPKKLVNDNGVVDLDAVIEKAQDKLKNLNYGSVPEKKEMKTHLATIITAYYIKQRQKRGYFLEVSPESFKKEHADIMKLKSFKMTMKENEEELYMSAINDKATGLWNKMKKNSKIVLKKQEQDELNNQIQEGLSKTKKEFKLN